MSNGATSPGILIVDDMVENLRLLAGMLTTHGFDVRPVTSGREALQAMTHALPDLVLLDVTMPEMSGFEVCAALKEKAEWRDIPVIFLTALTDVSDKVKGFAAGGTDYITKPFQLEEVLARVSNQLALRQVRQQLSDNLERLRKTERLRDDLIHMVVHDMRSPLAVMLTNLELIRDQITDSDLLEGLSYSISSTQRLCQMANTLLDISRMEAGKMPLKQESCDLVKLVTLVRATLAPMERERVIEVRSSDPVVALCDSGLIRRVLENLVSNGIKHTPPGGRIYIKTSASPGCARIAVRDEGPGVPPQAKTQIFEKFGAVAALKEHGYHSVGLGLAFCKLAVEAHGGHIGVDPVNPHGSSFWFELPA